MSSDNKYPLSHYSRKVQQGFAEANRRMMQRKAAMGYSLVVGTPDGKGLEKDAGELLEELRQTDWWTEHFPNEDAFNEKREITTNAWRV